MSARSMHACFVLAGACHAPAPAPTSNAPPPVRLEFAHLRHLMLDVDVAGRPARAIALYANAPEYHPSGSPARDGFEGMASVDDAARAVVLLVRSFEESRDPATKRD